MDPVAVIDSQEMQGGKEGYDVKSYYQQKLRMRNTLERAFASQVHQYHHDLKDKSRKNKPSLMETDQGDIELPSIGTPNENMRHTAPPREIKEPLHLPPSTTI